MSLINKAKTKKEKRVRPGLDEDIFYLVPHKMVANISQDTELPYAGVVHTVENDKVLLHFFESSEDITFVHEGEEYTLTLSTLSPGSMSIRSSSMRKDIYETFNISEEEFHFFNMVSVPTSTEVAGVMKSVELVPLSNEQTIKFASEEAARISAAKEKRVARLNKDNQ